ncbi:MAG: FHA domain-containing protein [Hyphomicrobium sp.]
MRTASGRSVLQGLGQISGSALRWARYSTMGLGLAAAAMLAPTLALATADQLPVQGGAAQAADGAIDLFQQWLTASYERAPALMLGLAALLAVPPLALIGLAIRRRDGGRSEMTQIRSRPPSGPGLPRDKLSTGFTPLRPGKVWIEVDGQDGAKRHAISAPLVRIGRESDNDICLSDMTVHRYHAAVHRTEDADYVITDLSSAGGNGVTVNGRTVAEARLSHGDQIELGRARLTFIARS